MANSIIKMIDDNGEITEKGIYTISPEKALVCYLEQTINKNFQTWNYFSDYTDRTGKVYSKSKFIDLIKQLPSKKGYTYFVPNTNTVISAYEA